MELRHLEGSFTHQQCPWMISQVPAKILGGMMALGYEGCLSLLRRSQALPSVNHQPPEQIEISCAG